MSMRNHVAIFLACHSFEASVYSFSSPLFSSLFHPFLFPFSFPSSPLFPFFSPQSPLPPFEKSHHQHLTLSHFCMQPMVQTCQVPAPTVDRLVRLVGIPSLMSLISSGLHHFVWFWHVLLLLQCLLWSYH